MISCVLVFWLLTWHIHMNGWSELNDRKLNTSCSAGLSTSDQLVNINSIINRHNKLLFPFDFFFSSFLPLLFLWSFGWPPRSVSFFDPLMPQYLNSNSSTNKVFYRPIIGLCAGKVSRWTDQHEDCGVSLLFSVDAFDALMINSNILPM